jgi:PIN domain nuclease of toxin-antitoxin system
MAKQRFVIDTNALIGYFHRVLDQPPRMSRHAFSLIRKAFYYPDEIILIIPSIAFIEVFEQFILNEESQAKFKAEVLQPIRHAPNIEIRPIDLEVLENFLLLEDQNVRLENHDRIILASAMALQCPLITSDPQIKRLNKRRRFIPKVIDT